MDREELQIRVNAIIRSALASEFADVAVLSRELLDAGRRAGIEEALAAYRSTSPQEDPEIYIEALLEAK